LIDKLSVLSELLL